MENVSKFSWFKLLSFFGTGILVFVCFVAVAGGALLIKGGNACNGVFAIVAGLVCLALAVWIYRNYQKKTSPDIKGSNKKE